MAMGPRIRIGARVDVEGADIRTGKNLRGTVIGPRGTGYFKIWYTVRLDNGLESGYAPERIRKLTPSEIRAELTPIELLVKGLKRNPSADTFEVGDRVETLDQEILRGTVVEVNAARDWPCVILDCGLRQIFHPRTIRKLTPLEALAELAPKKAKKNSGTFPYKPGTRVRCHRPNMPKSTWLGTISHGTLGGFIKIVFDDGYRAYVTQGDIEIIGPLEELASAAKDNSNRGMLEVGDRVRHIDGSNGWDKVGIGTVESTKLVKGLILVRFPGQNGLRRVLSGHFVRVSPLEELAALAPKAKSNPFQALRFKVGDRVRWFDIKNPEWAKVGVGTVVRIIEERRMGQDVDVTFDSGLRKKCISSNTLMLVGPLEELANVAKDYKKTKKNPDPVFKPGDRVRMCKKFAPSASNTVGTVQPDGGGHPHVHIVKWDSGATIYVSRLYLVQVSPLEELAATGSKTAKKNPKYYEGQRVVVDLVTAPENTKGTIVSFLQRYRAKNCTECVWMEKGMSRRYTPCTLKLFPTSRPSQR